MNVESRLLATLPQSTQRELNQCGFAGQRLMGLYRSWRLLPADSLSWLKYCRVAIDRACLRDGPRLTQIELDQLSRAKHELAQRRLAAPYGYDSATGHAIVSPPAHDFRKRVKRCVLCWATLRYSLDARRHGYCHRCGYDRRVLYSTYAMDYMQFSDVCHTCEARPFPNEAFCPECQRKRFQEEDGMAAWDVKDSAHADAPQPTTRTRSPSPDQSQRHTPAQRAPSRPDRRAIVGIVFAILFGLYWLLEWVVFCTPGPSFGPGSRMIYTE